MKNKPLNKPWLLFVYILLIHFNIQPSPWISVNNDVFFQNIEKLALCGIKISPHTYLPSPLIHLEKELNNTKKENLSKECLRIFLDTQKAFKNKLYKPKTRLGFQTKSSDRYFQDRSLRKNSYSTIFLDYENVSDKYAYKVSIQNTKDIHNDNILRFDESYFSFFLKNHAITFGRYSRWWSSSPNSSLILSNAARPSPGVSISNYQPKELSGILKYLGPISYEFFINQLEEDRHVPNTYFFGNRVSIYPNDRLSMSFFRTAQFGGDGRNLNTRIFIDMLLGKDNYETGEDGKNNEPGNQLGGADFKYAMLENKNLAFYGQIIGEDEAGYLPSKTFYNLGIEYFWFDDVLKKINFEYIDTGANPANTTYAHGIYESGYRYKRIPIGSAYDADSKLAIISYKREILTNGFLELKYKDGKLNYNENLNFYLGNKIIKFKSFIFSIKFKLSKNLYFKFNSILFDDDEDEKIDTILTLEYHW